MLVAGFLLALAPSGAAGAQRAGRRLARPRGCADRPEELLEQLYGRLAAGVLSAFHQLPLTLKSVIFNTVLPVKKNK